MSASGHSSSLKAIFFAFGANLAIALMKTAAAIYTNSGSMLAEAIHSYADTGNQVLLYLGLKQSQKQPDEKHPLGYGKNSYFWSFVVAVLLFSVGGLFSIYEGWHKLQHPEALNQAWIGLLVLGVAIIIEIISLLGCLSAINDVRGEKSLANWLKHTRNAELVVVLGEDSAAILGLIIAFVFVGISVLTDNPIYDAIGSICIGIVLIIVSIFVAWRIKALIIGASAEPEVREIINQIIQQDKNVEQLFNVITIQFGSRIMLAAKIKLPDAMPTKESVENINALEKKIKAQLRDVGWCFIELDSKD
ncbi:MAG: cation diffusion facilitator family transporter [Gammaproteobacteria bacterium]|nr:MAG: cation diffusion facilitator family transporter [Gammaproteobacteria bacterium]